MHFQFFFFFKLHFLIILKILIKDVGSSNGTFINGKRISEEGQQSASFELHTGDNLEFGIDIKNEEGDDSKFMTTPFFILYIK